MTETGFTKLGELDGKQSTSKKTQEKFLQLAAVGDIFFIILSLITGYYIRYQTNLIPFTVSAGPVDPPMSRYYGVMAVGAALLIFIFSNIGLYKNSALLRFRHIRTAILKGLSIWFFVYIACSFSLKFDPPVSRMFVAVTTLICGVMLISWRYVLDLFLHRTPVVDSLRQKIIFVGWSEQAERVYWEVVRDKSHPYEAVAVIASSEAGLDCDIPERIQKIQNPDLLKEIIECKLVDIVIVSDLDSGYEKIMEIASICEREYVQFNLIPSYFQILISGLHLETISGVPILGITQLPLDLLFNRLIKRMVDIVGAITGLILSFPVFVICGIIIYLESPGPIFFKQNRVGKKGEQFTMYKLRSMKIGAEKFDSQNQSTQRNDPRMLRIGKLIRRLNLDETPQFFNVLMGHMSLVGPRPERTYHSKKLSKSIHHYNLRYHSKPGLTGWAQVHGLRGDTDLNERVKYDLYYLENWNFWLDIQIIFMTLFTKKNAY